MNSNGSIGKGRDVSIENETDNFLQKSMEKLPLGRQKKEFSVNLTNISRESSNKDDGNEESYEEDENFEQKLINKPERRKTELNIFTLAMQNKKKSLKEQEEELILNNVTEMVKNQIMPRTTSNDLQDSNVLSFIEKSVMPNKTDNKLIKPKPKIKMKKIDSGLGDNTSFLIREMDKKLKRKINQKVASIIKSNDKLSNLSMPKEEIYSKLSHKLMEMQENHKLYKGEATNEISKSGRMVKEVSDDSKIMILYLSNLILFSKKTDAVKVIEEYGKYFYDKNLCEANLRKLKGLALIRNKKDHSFETSTEAIKEFLHAKVIFQKHD